MTIVDVKTQPATGSSKYAVGGSYQKQFDVYFSSGFSAAALRLNTDGRLPKAGWTLGLETGATETDTSVYADQIDIALKSSSPNDTGVAAYVVTYQTVPTSFFNPNPLDRYDIQWGGSELTEVVRVDVDGQPLLNSAGQMYSQLPERPIRGGEVLITVNRDTNPADICVNYSYSTNQSTWYGVAAENAQLGKITARRMQEDGLNYWQLQFPIRMRRDGWKLKLIDNGFVFTNDDGDPQAVTDSTGQRTPEAVLLDGNGGVLDPAGTPVVYPTAGFRISEPMPWATLNLPNPFAA